jgi:metal-dependent amidase/aminoacylase/carboxypeptidase family protein
MTTPVDRIRTYHPELKALRRDIHAHPELAFEESRTASLVAERLKGWASRSIPGSRRQGL